MAKFNFVNLDQSIRSLMLAEINDDIQADRLYISQRLNKIGKNLYPDFLIDAATNSDEEAFEQLLDLATHFNPTYIRQGKDVRMPSNAATLLCQSEFNRYYIRAICLHAIANNVTDVEIYRGRESNWSRSESESKIGGKISAQNLLADLRASIGIEPGLLPDINSGLSVKIDM